jgi:23S rRNA (pseudouridine1915-N3)-methyltransferase
VHVRLVAVGDRQPSWVATACSAYESRLPRQWRFRLHEIPAAQRRKNDATEIARSREGDKLLAGIRPNEYVVLLEERGRQFSSRDLAVRLEAWQSGGDDLVFVIGGPDGVSDAVHERADLAWSLSRLTLPHGLARVLVTEQLYRAWSLTTGHPYHRD